MGWVRVCFEESATGLSARTRGSPNSRAGRRIFVDCAAVQIPRARETPDRPVGATSRVSGACAAHVAVSSSPSRKRRLYIFNSIKLRSRDFHEGIR